MTSTAAAPKQSVGDATSETTAAAWQRAYAANALVTMAHELEQVFPADSLCRGSADALAAWQRWHQPQCDALFSSALQPWYAVLERARVEILAGTDLPGMACNLADLAQLSPSQAPFRNLYLAARTALSSGDGAISQAPIMASRQAPTSLMERWFKRKVMNSPAPTPAQVTETLRQASVELHDGLRFAQTVLPLVMTLAAHHASATPGMEDLSGHTPPGHDGLPQQDDPESDSDSDSERSSTEGADSAGMPPVLSAERAYPGYKVWTYQWDQEGPASTWLSPQDGAALQQLKALDQTKARQLAQRLQRQLLAARLCHWSFDQEEGCLDSRRLTRLLANEGRPRVFRIQAEAAIPEACVTLLVDQSASMRGTRQQMTAQAIDLAVHTLQACQIPCEVLGYTTRFGLDNPVAHQCLQAGHPTRPGRLNALRHIVYKTPAQPWRHTRAQLGLLLREGFGHENIDGEALHWAACRLMRQAQQRKILVVLSDGSPYDQATTQVHGRNYLENHLREVIAEIERSSIHLVAVGAGQDVGRYYRHALTLKRPDAVAEVLFAKLAELLIQPASPRR